MQSQGKKELSEQEKEWKFARWFWRAGDASSWQVSKIIITLIVAITIAFIGYFSISFLYTTPTAILVGVALLLVIGMLLNMDIRNTFRQLFRRDTFQQVKTIESFQNLTYYFLNEREDVLFIENGRDLTAIGLFKLKAIPLVIKGNFERFIRSLYQQQVPLFWVYGQAPIEEGAILQSPAISEEARNYYSEQSFFELESRMETHGGMWAARIIFGTRRSVMASGNLEGKRILLYKQLSADLFKIHTAFTSAYPHTVLESLSGKELEKGFSLVITGGGIPAFF